MPVEVGESTHGVPTALANLLVKITALSTTPRNNITGTASTDSTLYGVEIDARENPGEHVFLRIFDHAAPTLGTTDAHVLLRCLKGLKTSWYFKRGIPFVVGMSVAVTISPGATSGADPPTGQVDVRLAVKDS